MSEQSEGIRDLMAYKSSVFLVSPMRWVLISFGTADVLKRSREFLLKSCRTGRLPPQSPDKPVGELSTSNPERVESLWLWEEREGTNAKSREPVRWSGGDITEAVRDISPLVPVIASVIAFDG